MRPCCVTRLAQALETSHWHLRSMRPCCIDNLLFFPWDSISSQWLSWFHDGPLCHSRAFVSLCTVAVSQGHLCSTRPCCGTNIRDYFFHENPWNHNGQLGSMRLCCFYKWHLVPWDSIAPQYSPGFQEALLGHNGPLLPQAMAQSQLLLGSMRPCIHNWHLVPWDSIASQWSPDFHEAALCHNGHWIHNGHWVPPLPETPQYHLISRRPCCVCSWLLIPRACAVSQWSPGLHEALLVSQRPLASIWFHCHAMAPQVSLGLAVQ